MPVEALAAINRDPSAEEAIEIQSPAGALVGNQESP